MYNLQDNDPLERFLITAIQNHWATRIYWCALISVAAYLQILVELSFAPTVLLKVVR